MSRKYNKTKVNFYIDLALLILLGGLIGIGILIKYVLIPGQESWILFGENMTLTFLGLSRHEWGTIHLVTGILFSIAFLLHFIFHWNMIKCMFRQCLPVRSIRYFIAVFSVILFVVLIVFPFFVNPVKEPISKGAGRFSDEKLSVELNDSIRVEMKKPKDISDAGEPQMEINKIDKGEEDVAGKLKEIEIKGNMTLSEVSEKYNYPLSKLTEELDIPGNVDKDEKLGRLRKKYDFRLSKVKEIIQRDR